MINSLLLFLREVLTLSFLLGLLLIYASWLRLPRFHLLISLVASGVIAYYLAQNLPWLTELNGGYGQELVFALVLLCQALLIFLLNLTGLQISLIERQPPPLPASLQIRPLRRMTQYLIGLCIVLVSSFHGTELVIYCKRFALAPQLFTAHFTGAVLGTGIGVSLAVLTYRLLKVLGQSQFIVSSLLLIFMACGMLSQSVSYLEQANIIQASLPVWHSEAWLEEESLLGQLLSALFGYSSAPTQSQIIIYWTAVAMNGLGFLCFRPKQTDGPE